jgi:hypothetical protein
VVLVGVDAVCESLVRSLTVAVLIGRSLTVAGRLRQVAARMLRSLTVAARNQQLRGPRDVNVAARDGRGGPGLRRRRNRAADRESREPTFPVGVQLGRSGATGAR